MKTLYANGCSFTYGDGLEEITREENCFVGQLATKIPFNNVVNAGHPGSSNQGIVRRTLDYFIEKINNQEDVSNHVALIQFSNPLRFEVYLEEKNYWHNMLPCNDHDEGFESLYGMFEFSTPEQELANALLHVTTLGNFFEKYNIKYMFVDLSNLFPEHSKHCDTYNLYYETCKQYNWYNTPNTSAIVEMPEYEEIEHEVDFHPNAKSHAAIAERYTERLVMLYPDIASKRKPTREELVKEKMRLMKERDPFIYK